MLPDRLRSSAGPGALAIARYGHADRVVVCLHGFPLSSFSWRHVAPVLARAGWTVVCPDLLGAGESDRPLDASLTPTAQARWVREALAALGVTRAVLVGHDAGALVACHLAIGAPELVHALALVSPVVPGAMPPADVRALQRDTGRLAVRLARDVVAAAELIEPLLAARAAGPLDVRTVAGATAPFVGREGAQQLLALARALDDEGEQAVDPTRVAQPVRVFVGEHEEVGRGSPVAGFTAALRNAQLVRIPGVRALLPEEAPGALAAALVTFLSSYVTVDG